MNGVAFLAGDGGNELEDDEGTSSGSSGVQTTEEKREEEMQIYWSYIVGMLTNLGSLPAERIQQMLILFVQGPNKYDKSVEELRAFLAVMIREEKVELVGGTYQLKK